MVVLAIAACITIRFAWCRYGPTGYGVRRREFSQIDVMKMAWTGASLPQAVCMIAWPLYPPALGVLTDAPMLLIPTGFSAIALVIGDVFDRK